MTGEEAKSATDEAVSAATRELGEPIAEFRANLARVRTKLFLGVGLLLTGVTIAALWLVFIPGRVDHMIIHFILWPVAIGVGLLWHLWKHRGLRVLVYPAGLFILENDTATSFPWEEVKAVRFTPAPKGEPQIVKDHNGEVIEAWLPINEPKMQLWSGWLEMTRTDGTATKLTGALADLPKLAMMIQIATFARLREALRTAMQNGEALSISKTLTIDSHGLKDGKLRIHWKDVKEITMLANLIFIRKKHSWRGGITKAATAIDNLHVLIAVAAEKNILKWKP